ncbi:serine/threonine protein kinase NPR1 Ecym_6425 [Eremothecium cymbalariae DBVPG|uniref:non-specific serine/threonine protein kinase n=1 Tax=Eremothecium cymbalariae (strain CBS 270.75 / DBVPG 7215 / KCTC 17166 / NRRL Y-17582) TaxID=931890 RepID=G8JUL7_ERECY|nr:hypothetical protein Ecym_6425 [Eremothecium cymbalariae DBVPG\
MSSLTKLLQEKRKNEIVSANLASSLQAAVLTEPLVDHQRQNAVEKPSLTQRYSSTTTITQVNSNSDSDTTPNGSMDRGNPLSQSFMDTNSAYTAAFYRGSSMPCKDRTVSVIINEGINISRNSSAKHSWSHSVGRNYPSLSSSIPYSVPNSNSNGASSQTSFTQDNNNPGNTFVTSQWIEKYGNSLPKNVSAIDSNIISSPKVGSVEPRFVISRQKLQKSPTEITSNHSISISRSSSLSSQLGNFFFTKSSKDIPFSSAGNVPTSSNSCSNKENVNNENCIPKPIRARQSSVYSTSRQPTGSYNDNFAGSPSSLQENPLSHQATKSRHSSFADLKRFFKRSGSNSQLSVSPGTPPVSNGSISSHSSNHSSTFTAGSYGSQNGEVLFNPTGSAVSQGLTFFKRYSKTGEKLGAGAGGSVRLVRRLRDNTVFAVKEFRPKYDNESKRDYIKKITSEYCIGTALRHPNIISTIEIVYDNNRILQVMEYCDYDLFAIVMSNKMSYEEINCCFKQILVGVEYLHSMGLAHRDLKLDNCVINRQGIVKLIDFGAAVVFTYPHSGTLVEASGIVGSDPYLAPEVCIFTKYDPRPVDIWSVAIIYACMILKKFPWKIPKLKDNSFKFFCSGRDCDSLSALVTRTPEPPSYDNMISGNTYSSPAQQSNNPSDPNNPNIGPQRLLHSLPEESQNIIGRMVTLAPACRASIDEIMEDDWIRSIDICYVNEVTDRLITASDHKHTQVDQSEAHIAGLEKKKKRGK